MLNTPQIRSNQENKEINTNTISKILRSKTTLFGALWWQQNKESPETNTRIEERAFVRHSLE